MTCLIVCTCGSLSLSVLKVSLKTYNSNVNLHVFKSKIKNNFGCAYNKALQSAFKTSKSVLFANDDIVLLPNTIELLLDDVEALKKTTEKLGLVVARADNVRGAQSIKQIADEGIIEAPAVSPILAWMSREAFDAAQFPPLNWFSDDVLCEDLARQGYRHFISRSYVHHVGSATIGHDNHRHVAEAMPWLLANRPEYVRKWWPGWGETMEPVEKKPLKICVYAISKNEKQFVERFCKSAKAADMIVIADTGSTDGTPEEAARCGAIVHDICITPWRFDFARNAALALIPREMDVCISLDLDELLEPGWREEIERVWEANTTRLRYYFDWGAGIRFKYEKIHARHGYFWHHPCHEYPVPDGRITEVWADTDMLLVSHHPDPTKSRGQYLDLLKLSVKEDPRCSRNAFYYARELTFYSRWNDAIEALERYLEMPEATWPNERCYAYRLLGKSWKEVGDWYKAEIAFGRACAEAPNTREPWCDIAMLYYQQGRWEECYMSSMRALRIKDKQLVYTCDPAVWGYWAHDLASISAWHMGLKDTALEQAKLALEMAPEDSRLQANLAFIMEALEPKE